MNSVVVSPLCLEMKTMSRHSPQVCVSPGGGWEMIARLPRQRGRRMWQNRPK
jgi:hypothetical protein